MKTSKVTLMVISAVAVLAAGASGQTPAYDLNDINFEYRSEEKATQYSLAGTLMPIVAGIVWWGLDDPDSAYEYNSDGRISRAYIKDPDRTIPVMLIFSGLLIGPSVGYFYGDCPERGTTGLLVRTGTGLATMMVGASIASSSRSDGFCDYSGMAAGLAVGAIGTGVILIEVIYDLTKVKTHVANKNMQKARQAGTSLTLYPKYFADSGASGLELNISF